MSYKTEEFYKQFVDARFGILSPWTPTFTVTTRTGSQLIVKQTQIPQSVHSLLLSVLSTRTITLLVLYTIPLSLIKTDFFVDVQYVYFPPQP